MGEEVFPGLKGVASDIAPGQQNRRQKWVDCRSRLPGGIFSAPPIGGTPTNWRSVDEPEILFVAAIDNGEVPGPGDNFMVRFARSGAALDDEKRLGFCARFSQ